VTPKSPVGEMDKLKREISTLKAKTDRQGRELNQVKSNITPVTPIVYKTGGTGFMIDGKGYLVTNSHVVENANNIAVQNTKGTEYVARIVYNNPEKDIAILKIDDENFKSLGTIPYAVSKSAGDLAEPIYTLGYPRNEIVYGQGYLSAKTGFNGDTLSCQIEIAANRGNSGSPILNNNGEVIGILNGRQTNAEGFAFAIRSKYIYQALDELRSQNDTSYQRVKLSSKSSMAGMDRKQQVKKLEDYVFMVKVN
jgi:S1-C subfamily serine protease